MSSYRDDREAALAQAAALQQERAALEAQNQALAQNVQALAQENDQLRRAAGLPPRQRAPRVVLFIVLGAVVALMAVAGVLVFTLVNEPVPSSAVPSVPPISSVPTPSMPPTPPTPPTPPPTQVAPPT